MEPEFLKELDTPIEDPYVLYYGFLIRDGFVFILGDKPGVFDTLQIRWPQDATAMGARMGMSTRSLEEHIQLIQSCKLRKVKVICRDLSFLRQCTELRQVTVVPADDSGPNFDYSPLYEMPQLECVNCRTEYAPREQYRTALEYRRFAALRAISAAGPGHIGFEEVPGLRKLSLCRDTRHTDMTGVSCSTDLREAFFLQCKLRSLRGLEQHPELEDLTLLHCRSLADISDLRHCSSLRTLAMETCPKIQDFSVLETLENLEHLQLFGSQTLPSLDFVKKMPKLRTFVFTMDVADGNLMPCMGIPYASCKNRKHFNLKDAQLPKARRNGT